MRSWIRYLLAICAAVFAAGLTLLVGGEARAAAFAGLGAGGATALAEAWNGSQRRKQVSLWAEALTRAAASASAAAPSLPEPRVYGWRPLHRALLAYAQGVADTARLRSLDVRILDAVIDGMSQGTWITDSQGTVIRYNAALTRMLPRGADPFGQRPLSLLRSTALHEAVIRACSEGRSAQLEIALEGPISRILSVQVRPLGKDLPGSAAVFEDVTSLRRLEQVRKDFVANVSHELRTPITAILGYAETLQAGALQDQEHAAAMVDIIHRQSVRLSELVQDLLELSKLEAKKVVVARVRVSVNEAISNAMDTVGPKAQSKDIALRAQLPEPLWGVGDPRALEQVLLNLLDNAIKYTPAGGQVEVRGSLEGDRCRVEIQDSGMGIERHHLPRIFERFYRIDKGRSRDMGGTGLGLAIVKHLINAMGGDVQVDSQPGQGSVFTVFLPVPQAVVTDPS